MTKSKIISLIESKIKDLKKHKRNGSKTVQSAIYYLNELKNEI